MSTTAELQPGMRVPDPTDPGRALTVDRIEDFPVVHCDDTRALQVFFRYPHEREPLWAHRDHEWTVSSEPCAPEPIQGTEYSAVALTHPGWTQRLADGAKRAVTE